MLRDKYQNSEEWQPSSIEKKAWSNVTYKMEGGVMRIYGSNNERESLCQAMLAHADEYME